MSIALGDPVLMSGLYDSRFHEVTSRINGQSYRIFVGGPAPMFVGGGLGTDRKFPTVYVLDGKLNFAMVHGQCQLLSALGQMPPAYVVGIAFGGDATFFDQDVVKRHRDLTPTPGGALEKSLLGLNTVGRDQPATGGGPDFMAFLRDELRPALEDVYPLNRGDATILGNSLGGLFPSWLLFHHPALFQRYVIVSPSWWWNDYEMWRWEQAYADTHADLPAKVFVAAGGLENAQALEAMFSQMMGVVEGELKVRVDAFSDAVSRYGWPKMVELMPEFEARLRGRNYPGLDLAVLDFPEETHESIPGGAFSRGLRFVFGSWKPSSEPKASTAGS
jgi:predicted alpha/beta superfamily hydrolase